MSEKSTTPSTAPSNNGQTIQKKKSFRHKKSNSNLNRHKKSNSNLKVKPLEQMEIEVGKQKKVNSDKIPKNQVNKENNDNNKPEVEKKEVDKKKNRYNKKKSMSDLKKDDSKSDTVSETKSDITYSSTNDKPELKKSASKQLKKRKSKAFIKEKANKTEEEQKEEDNADIKLIDSFLTVLSMKRDEMEKEEEELINNPPQQNKYTTTKRQSYTNKANKPKKEIPVYDDVEIRKVLDCYDFPTSYKTHNLLEIFEEFKGKFRINWINDSRALFIFDTEEHARAALLSKIDETRYVIKPYENPNSDSSSYSLNDEYKNETKEIKQNIKQPIYLEHTTQQIHSATNNSRTSQTYESTTQDKTVRRQRPVTSDAVARRLIANALGVRPKEKTEEEKEIDRKKFEEARAKRLAEKLERQKRLQENSDIFNE